MEKETLGEQINKNFVNNCICAGISLREITEAIKEESDYNNDELEKNKQGEFYPTNNENECKIELKDDEIVMTIYNSVCVSRKYKDTYLDVDYENVPSGVCEWDLQNTKFLDLQKCPKWISDKIVAKRQNIVLRDKYDDIMSDAYRDENYIPVSVLFKIFAMANEKQEQLINEIDLNQFSSDYYFKIPKYDYKTNSFNIDYEDEDLNKGIISVSMESGQPIIQADDEIKNCDFYSDLENELGKFFSVLTFTKRYQEIMCDNIKVYAHDNFNVSIKNQEITLKMNNQNPGYEQEYMKFIGNGSILFKSGEIISSFDKQKIDNNPSEILENTFISVDDCPEALRDDIKRICNLNIKRLTNEIDGNYTLSPYLDDYYENFFFDKYNDINYYECNDNKTDISAVLSDDYMDDSYISISDIMIYSDNYEQFFKDLHISVNALPDNLKKEIKRNGRKIPEKVKKIEKNKQI